MHILQSSYLARFTCLGDACEDTCCKGWGMQVDPATYARYEKEAPELLPSVASGEAGQVMRRDPETDFCVKFEQGWCGIQKRYGTGFLGDACHFYPRVTRQLGGQVVMTAALSCPAIVQLALIDDSGFSYLGAEVDRLPVLMKPYSIEGISDDQALALHELFLQAALDVSVTPERSLARIASVSRSLQTLPLASWPQAVPFYLQHADHRLPVPETRPEDPFHLLHALTGLVEAAPKSGRPRLEQVILDMHRALGVTIPGGGQGMQLSGESLALAERIQILYRQEWKSVLAPLLRRYLAAQYSLALFPFAGLGATLTERITIIGVRFATFKLALLSAIATHHLEQRPALTPEVTATLVRVTQSLSRFLDHLADPELSLRIYEETGWLREPRMRGLLGEV